MGALRYLALMMLPAIVGCATSAPFTQGELLSFGATAAPFLNQTSAPAFHEERGSILVRNTGGGPVHAQLVWAMAYGPQCPSDPSR